MSEPKLEKIIAVFTKLTLSQAIEYYYGVGKWLHEKIDLRQKELADQANSLQKTKESIKSE